MKSNNNIAAVAAIVLAVLVGYLLWLAFSSDLPILPSRISRNDDEVVRQEKVAATPQPDPDLDSQPALTEKNDSASIESDLKNTVILDENFTDIDK